MQSGPLDAGLLTAQTQRTLRPLTAATDGRDQGLRHWAWEGGAVLWPPSLNMPLRSTAPLQPLTPPPWGVYIRPESPL